MAKPAAPEPATTYTLDTLHQKLGAPDPALSAALVDEETREEFIALGVQIASRHILSDAPRLYGIAYEFLTTASPAQRETIDVTLDLLAVGVQQAIKLRAMSEGSQRVEGTDTAERAKAEREAASAFELGMGLRTKTVRLLKAIAGRNADLRKRADDQTGTAETPEALAQGLESLSSLLREFLGHKKDNIAARVKLYGATEARAAKLDETAALIRKTAKAASARSVSRVRQLEIDFQDGVCLHILGELIHAFDGAHEMDASIPRLVPIATRRLLGRQRRKAPAGEGEAGGGATGGKGDEGGTEADAG